MATRDLIIRVQYDATQADQQSEAFWRREAERQQGAAIAAAMDALARRDAEQFVAQRQARTLKLHRAGAN